MPLAWPDLHHRLVRSLSSFRFQQQFGALRTSHPALQRFRDPPALLEYLHHGVAPPDQKNMILRALVLAAQAEDGNVALTVLLLALWPGLDAVRRRVIRRWSWESNEAAADLLARVCDAIRCLNLERVTWIAAAVLRNVERDVGRQLSREARQQDVRVDIEPDAVPVHRMTAWLPLTDWFLRHDLGRLAGPDAELVMRIALMSQTQVEAGAALGLTEAAARKRFQRAARRLQVTLH